MLPCRSVNRYTGSLIEITILLITQLPMYRLNRRPVGQITPIVTIRDISKQQHRGDDKPGRTPHRTAHTFLGTYCDSREVGSLAGLGSLQTVTMPDGHVPRYLGPGSWPHQYLGTVGSRQLIRRLLP